MQATCKAAGKWLMVLSLCAALGLHWAALQSVAWIGMVITYSHSGSVAAAVANTFDGNHPCPLCKAIAKGEQSGKKQDFQPGAGKIDMDFCRQSTLLFPPRQGWKWLAFASIAPAFSPEPVVPPPRGV